MNHKLNNMKHTIIAAILFLSFSAKSQFYADTTIGNVPLIVTFTDTTKGAVSWLWDFGDGFNGNTNPCTHPYLQNGEFTVSCKVLFSDGSKQTFVRYGYIKVGNCKIADLSNDNHKYVEILESITDNVVRLKIPCNYRIISISGQVVKKGYGNEIDLTNFDKGVYFIQINVISNIKFIKL